MLSIAAVLFVLGLLIHLFGLSGVFPAKRFPYAMDTPCMLSFVVLGIIFLNLGIIYRDMTVHPGLFQTEEKETGAGEKEGKDLIHAGTESRTESEKKSLKREMKQGGRKGEEEIKELIDVGGP